MSDETSQTPENEGALDLSGLNFGPAWARDKSESKSLKKFKDRGDRDDSRGDRGGRHGGGGRGDRRQGGGGRDGQRRDHRGGGGGFKGRGGHGGRRDDDRRPQRQEVEPPQGVSIQIMPAEESLDLLAKQVIDTGRTFSVFDLAKVLLQKRDRFRVTFDSPEKKIFRCREDQSIWLTRDEALRHLWRANWLGKYYEEVKVEGEAPKGSFSSVARCGISNEILGPPNYHGYQEKLAALHRERFSNMSLDGYKAKVRMEHGEEAVEAWLESMKTVTKWKVADPEKKEEPAVAEEAAPVVSDEPAEPQVEEAPAAEEAPVAEEVTAPTEDVVEDAPAAEEETQAPEEETPAPEEEAELFADARAVERHFAETNFAKAFEETNRAWVLGDVPGNLLSAGLLTLLKRCVAEEKRYPSNLMPLVCRQLSGRHVAVFKWEKKLKVGPSRPHAVAGDTQLAERPQKIIDFATANSGSELALLWEAIMPKEVTDEEKHQWFHDLHWLLNQGHVILLSDTTLHIAKKGDGDAPKKRSKKKAPKKKEAKGPKAEEPKAEELKAEELKAEELKAEELKAEELKAEEPKAEEPKAEEPKAEEPKAESSEE